MGVPKGLRRGKKSLAMASRLDGPAFECYARMSEEHQKYPAVISEVVNRSLSTQKKSRYRYPRAYVRDDLGAQLSL